MLSDPPIIVGFLSLRQGTATLPATRTALINVRTNSGPFLIRKRLLYTPPRLPPLLSFLLGLEERNQCQALPDSKI